jgi:hypothetical protein
MPIGLCVILGTIALAVMILGIVYVIEDPLQGIPGLILAILLNIVVFGSIYGNNIEVRTYQVIMSKSITEKVADCDYQYYTVKFYDREQNVVYITELDENEYNLPEVGEKFDMTFHEFKKKYKIIDREYIKS